MSRSEKDVTQEEKGSPRWMCQARLKLPRARDSGGGAAGAPVQRNVHGAVYRSLCMVSAFIISVFFIQNSADEVQVIPTLPAISSQAEGHARRKLCFESDGDVDSSGSSEFDGELAQTYSGTEAAATTSDVGASPQLRGHLHLQRGHAPGRAHTA